MDLEEKKKELNELLKNPRENFETLKGFEIVLEALVYKIYSLFGKNALLTMMYQIGSGPGHDIAQRLLKERGGKKVEDPFEAIKLLLNENKDYYSIQIREIKKEPYDDKFDKLVFIIENQCFYRQTLKNRPRIKIGGPLCRINKAYFETAFKELAGLKTEIEFVRNDEENDKCIEKVTFFIPKEKEGK